MFYTILFKLGTYLGKLSDKIGHRKMFAFGLLVFSFVYFSFGVIKDSLFLWFLFPIYRIYIAATDGLSKAYLGEFISEKEAGSVYGLYQMLLALASFFASFFGGILWTKIGPQATFYFGAIMAFISFSILSFGKFWKKFNIMRLNKRLIFYLALNFMPLGNGLANPSIQAIASEDVPKEEYGGTLGLLQSAGSLGRILGPIIGGELFYHFGKDIPFLLPQLFCFLFF